MKYVVVLVLACTSACGSSSKNSKAIEPSHGDGGSSSSSGSDARAADAAAHIVSACPPLADGGGDGDGGDPVGTFVDITPPQINLDPKYMGFNVGVGAFVVDPTNSSTLYVGSCSQGIYKTTDCGSTWTHVNTGTNGAALDTGRQWTMEIDPTQPNVIYANGGYGPLGLFKSTNSGQDWTQMFDASSDFATYVPSTFVEQITLDPGDPTHMLVSSHDKCTGPYAGAICFAESTDSGQTWTMIKGDPNMFYEAAGQAIVDKKTWLFFDPGSGIYVTQDEGGSWQHVYSAQGAAANQSGKLYHAADGNYYVAGYGGVVKSKDLVNWTLIANSPPSFSIAGDGTITLLSDNQMNTTVEYYSANGDFTSWAAYPSPKMSYGSWIMRYDPDHNLIYGTNGNGGFWRVRIK